MLSDALARLSMSRLVQRVFAIKSQNRRKSNKCKIFWPQFSGGGATPTVLRQIVSANYRPIFGKVWLSSVCWCPSAKPGNEVELSLIHI